MLNEKRTVHTTAHRALAHRARNAPSLPMKSLKPLHRPFEPASFE